MGTNRVHRRHSLGFVAGCIVRSGVVHCTLIRDVLARCCHDRNRGPGHAGGLGQRLGAPALRTTGRRVEQVGEDGQRQDAVQEEGHDARDG